MSNLLQLLSPRGARTPYGASNINAGARSPPTGRKEAATIEEGRAGTATSASSSPAGGANLLPHGGEDIKRTKAKIAKSDEKQRTTKGTSVTSKLPLLRSRSGRIPRASADSIDGSSKTGCTSPRSDDEAHHYPVRRRGSSDDGLAVKLKAKKKKKKKSRATRKEGDELSENKEEDDTGKRADATDDSPDGSRKGSRGKESKKRMKKERSKEKDATPSPPAISGLERWARQLELESENPELMDTSSLSGGSSSSCAPTSPRGAPFGSPTESSFLMSRRCAQADALAALRQAHPNAFEK